MICVVDKRKTEKGGREYSLGQRRRCKFQQANERWSHENIRDLVN
jgi:hypothetical protein